MQLGRVLGTATSTVKHPDVPGGAAAGRPARDGRRPARRRAGPGLRPAGRGTGDVVLVTNDGLALQELLGRTTPGRWSVMGLPDTMSDTRGTMVVDIEHGSDGAGADRRGRCRGPLGAGDRAAIAAASVGETCSPGGCSRCVMPRRLPPGRARSGSPPGRSSRRWPATC